MPSADTIQKRPTRFEYPVDLDDLSKTLGNQAVQLAQSRQTPWEDIQGIEPEARVYSNGVRYTEAILSDWTTRPEMLVLFEHLNLPELNDESIRSMTKRDMQELAEHLVVTVDGDNLPGVLGADACDYKSFGFDNERQAQDFARVLNNLRLEIRKQPFYGKMKKMAGDVNDARRRVKDRTVQRGDICVVYDTESQMLRTHFEKAVPAKTKVA